MPTRRIADLFQRICRSPDHDPPRHLALAPGLYEHVCSGCGRRLVFRVAGGVFFGVLNPPRKPPHKRRRKRPAVWLGVGV